MERKLLIVGGCGFIGVNLIAHLNALGYRRITVLDNESVGKRENLAGLEAEGFQNGDIRNPGDVERAVRGQNDVILLAAQTNVIKSIKDPRTDCEVNVMGALNVFEGARQGGIERIVVASSSAPIGNQPPPMSERLAPRPASPYGASKAAVEAYCSAYFESFGLKTVALRFSNCYGPGSDNKSSVVAHFIRRILADEPLQIYGDGEQTRDFIYVEDLCRAIGLALTAADPSCFGRPYQVATGVETTLNELVAKLRDLVREAGRDFEVANVPARSGEIVRNYADVSDIARDLDFKPTVSLDDGLRRTWNYFLDRASRNA